jgi:hypothetical protein
MEFQSASTCSDKIRDSDKISKDLSPSNNTEISKEVPDFPIDKTDSEIKIESLSPESKSPKAQDIEQVTFSTSQPCKTDDTEEVGKLSLYQIQETVLSEAKDEKQEENEMIKTETADNSVEIDPVDPGLGISQTDSKIAEDPLEVPGSSSEEHERSENNCNDVRYIYAFIMSFLKEELKILSER